MAVAAPQKVVFSWSGGKDSAFALSEFRKAEGFEIVSLLTTLSDEYNRVSMHGVRWALIEKQAESIGLPLEEVRVPKRSSNEEYEKAMGEFLLRKKKQGVSAVVFGDIFLEDLRAYREERLEGIGMDALFPIWKRDDTGSMAREFIREGFRAVVVCVDSKALDGSFVGREFDEQFIEELPRGIDPCGENGEFHSFAYAGPIFRKAIRFEKGEIVKRDNWFYYCDLKPAPEFTH
jgi:uncharacterized protein (TIGR00290 family)